MKTKRTKAGDLILCEIRCGYKNHGMALGRIVRANDEIQVWAIAYGGAALFEHPDEVRQFARMQTKAAIGAKSWTAYGYDPDEFKASDPESTMMFYCPRHKNVSIRFADVLAGMKEPKKRKLAYTTGNTILP